MNYNKRFPTVLIILVSVLLSCIDGEDESLRYNDFVFTIEQLTIGTNDIITKAGEVANGKITLISDLETAEDYYLSVSFTTGAPGGLSLWTTKAMLLEQQDGSARVTEFRSDLQIGKINASETNIELEFKLDGKFIKPIGFQGSQEIIKLRGKKAHN